MWQTLCLGIVMEEYPTFWDKQHSSTYLIWNRFVNTLHMFHIPNVKKRQNVVWRTIPWRYFNRFDDALFTVKVVVSKALLQKG